MAAERGLAVRRGFVTTRAEIGSILTVSESAPPGGAVNGTTGIMPGATSVTSEELVNCTPDPEGGTSINERMRRRFKIFDISAPDKKLPSRLIHEPDQMKKWR
jgi:hypothetical protein